MQIAECKIKRRWILAFAGMTEGEECGRFEKKTLRLSSGSEFGRFRKDDFNKASL
jgi:hypothetical protein